MSTTIKRVALVAVAALGLGVLSVAPSSAAPQADTFSISAATASTTVGTAVTVNATQTFLPEGASDTMTITATFDQAPAGIAVTEVVWSSISAVATDLGSPAVDTATARIAKIGSATTSVNKTLTLQLTPSKAGTYVIRLTPKIDGSTTAPVATAKTWTVTVAAKTLGWNSAFIGTGVTANDTATADATVTTSSTASTTAKARIDVGQGYGTTSGSDTATAADAASVVVATDKGLVAKSSDYTTSAKSVTLAAATDADSSFYVFSNGDVGKASITITVGGVLVATKNVSFTGPATALVATLQTGAAAWTAVGGTSLTDITSTDAGSTVVSNPSGLTVKSSDTAVATATISSGVVTVTGQKAGTATITVTDPATSGAATPVSFTATVATVRPTVAPTITFDKSSYAVGELVTLTVAAGMSDSATAQLFTSTGIVLSASVNASGTAIPTNGQHAIVGGKATYKFYAPAVSGSLTATATTGGAVNITDAATITSTVDIVNPGVDAATDAANEAAQAASDATDAALAAADAADLATDKAQEAVDAVATLSAEVTKLITALKAQITTLTNLVLKIQKKVKA